MEFRWNRWNIEHLAEHGVDLEAAEWVVENAAAPYPRRVGQDKLLVWGRAPEGDLLQVVFVLDEDGTTFVIHARRLTKEEKGSYRSRR